MKLIYSVPAGLVGVAAIAIVHSQIALASKAQQVADQFTVLIRDNGGQLGSGTLLAKEGNTYYVVTADHVPINKKEYNIVILNKTRNQKQYRVNYDRIIKLQNVDLAILPFESQEEYTIPNRGNSQSVVRGEIIYVSGYSTDSSLNSSLHVVEGRISANPENSSANEDRNNWYYTNLTTDGMSGGPILNSQGHLIGIHRGNKAEVIPDGMPTQTGFKRGIPIHILLELVPKHSFEKGNEQLNQRKYREAIADFSLALRFNPKFADAYLGLSRAYFGMENYGEASRNVSSAIDNYPKTANNPQLAEAYRLRGAIFVEQKNYREAEKNYQQAIQFNSNDANFVADVQRRIEALPKPQISNVPQPKPTNPLTTGTQPVATRLSPDWVFTTLPAQAKVFTVAFSPDGRFLASGTEDGKIQLWDLTTRNSSAINAHSKGVNSIVFSPDGTKLASSGSDGVKIWNLQQGSLTPFRNLANASLLVRSIAFSPNGQTIATGTAEGQIKLWQVNTGKELPGLPGHTKQVSALAYSPDGQTIVSGGIDNTIKIWNLNQPNSRRALTLTGHQDLILSIIFSRDGQTLITSSRDRTIRMWNFNTRQLQRPPLSVDDRLSINIYVAISPDGNILASGNNSKIKIWNLSNNQSQELPGHNASVSSLVFSSDGKLASGSLDGTIGIWQKK